MTYSLRRISDGEGDSGNMSCAYSVSGGELITEHEAKPRVGVVMLVGSYSARTFDAQDWWQTKRVTEILEEHVDDEGDQWVRFRTQNSEYVWRYF